MNTITQRESAKIYEFPRRGTANPGGRPNGKSATDPRLQPAPGIAFGAWYHDAAVEESLRGRKS